LKGTYAGWTTTAAISGTEKPTITSNNKATGSTLAGWTTVVNAGDILQVSVDSAATLTHVLLEISYNRT